MSVVCRLQYCSDMGGPMISYSVRLLSRVAVPLLAMAGLLSACFQSSDSAPVYLQQMTGIGGVQQAALVPAGNYSFTTIRTRQQGPNSGILCVAPSPDWATAITTAQSLQGSVSTPVGTTVTASASNSLAETITAMVGRTAGVVALRDGLYNACQAYANGVIGKDAYALILSQYGNLLVALAGSGGGATTAAGPSAGISAQQLQLQMVQAMLVACISNNDRTIDNEEGNALLRAPGSAYCTNLVNSIVTAVPKLLTSVAPTAGAQAQGAKPEGSGGSKASGDKLVTEVQTFLKSKDCDGCQALEVDGIDGPKTQAAIAAYEKKSGTKLIPEK
jgi:hypothetical protein